MIKEKFELCIGPDDNCSHYPARWASWFTEEEGFENLTVEEIAALAKHYGYKVTKCSCGYFGDEDYCIGDTYAMAQDIIENCVTEEDFDFYRKVFIELGQGNLYNKYLARAILTI